MLVTGKAEIGLYGLSFFQETSDTTQHNTTGGWPQMTPEHYLITPQVAHSKGGLKRHKNLPGANSPLRSQFPHSSSYTVGIVNYHNQSA